MPQAKKKKTDVEPNCMGDDVVITDVRKVQELPEKIKRPMLIHKLTKKDYTVIVNNGCLSDDHIMTAQNILHQQFPLIDGFLSKSLGVVGQFTPMKSNFIQIIHTGAFHWLTVSNVTSGNQSPTHIDLYDSLYHGM